MRASRTHISLRFRFFIALLEFIYDELRYKLKGDRKPLKKEEEEDVEGEVVVITGANRGIGKQTALQFAQRGAIVVIGCRNVKNAEEAMEDIKNRTPNAKLDTFSLDLVDMDSVERFAKAVGAKYPKIKILVNNAGIGGQDCRDPKILTKDGLFNPLMAANYFGHFLLTNLLLKNLQMSTKPRVIVVTSILQRMCTSLDLEDLAMQKSRFRPRNDFLYNNSKFCGSLFAKELGEKMKKEGSDLRAYSVCPSLVEAGMTSSETPTTNIRDNRIINMLWTLGFGFSYEQAASEFIMHVSLSKKLGLRESGLMYQFRKPCGRCNPKLEELEEFRRKLWDKSAKLVKLEERSKNLNNPLKRTNKFHVT